MAREVDIQILGKTLSFQIADDVDSADFLQLIDYVETKINKIKNRMSELDSFKLGLLTSINIAQEYFALKKENQKLRDILQNIEALLAPESEEKQLPIRFTS